MQHYSQCVEVTTDGFDVVFIIRFLSSFFVWDLATFGDWHMFHYMGENNSIAPDIEVFFTPNGQFIFFIQTISW